MPATAAVILTLLSTLQVSLTSISAQGKSGDDPLKRIVANANRAPAGTVRKGVLTVHLEARLGSWYPEAEDGSSLVVQAFGEVGRPLQIPGPLIRVPAGTVIHATVRNALSDSSLVVYGLHARPGRLDDTIRIAAGATREVRFETGPPGTYYYWGSTTGRGMGERDGIDSQLSGALIVDPAGAAAAPNDRVFVIGLWLQDADSSGLVPRPERETMVINGKSWPHTERLTFGVGDSVHWRWINATASSHPMHLHGFYFRVDSRGTWAADTLYALSQRRAAVTELMLPGATNTFHWVPTTPGNWLFHCHFAFHVSHHLLLAPASTAGDKGHHTASHSSHQMAGLVLGMHVIPRGPTRAVSASERRKIRVLVQSSPRRYGAKPGYGFVIQRGTAEPARDSITVPSPPLILRRGEPVAITVVNRLHEQTAVHWHGLEIESFPDGVPGWSGAPGHILPPIQPNDSLTVEFTPPRAGTFIYHSHSNEGEQINSGLYGALIVVEPGQSFEPIADRIVIVGAAGPPPAPRQDAPALVNGSPAPPPMELEAGRTYRLRLINIHPDWRVMFSLVTDTALVRWRPVAKDGADLPPQQAMLRPAHLLTGPGETADFEFTPSRPGEYRLEVKTQLPGWHIPLLVRVRDAGRSGISRSEPNR